MRHGMAMCVVGTVLLMVVTGRLVGQEDAKKLEVKRESEVDGTKPGIYLGPAKFAAANGVDVGKLSRNNHECKMKRPQGFKI